ncbi:MAG TPA: alpha/beta hydrolase [Sporolactobacillaceae bacterium]|nr:alpha/beta hydrolase [Sporolactobacillaceae bacterium]
MGSCKGMRHAYGEHPDQFGELRLPEGDGPFPVIITIHGGFWRHAFGLDLMDDMASNFTSHGIATWNIEYRRVGQEGGAWPGTFLDVARATDFLKNLSRDYPLDLERVVAIGHSAGGHLALWLGARHLLSKESDLRSPIEVPLSLKGVVSLAGVSDLKLMHDIHRLAGREVNPTFDLLGGRPEDVPQRYQEGSPVQNVPLGLPQVLIHGALDVNVPVGMSAYYADKAKKTGDQVTFVELPLTEHFKVIDPKSDVWPTIFSETLQLL